MLACNQVVTKTVPADSAIFHAISDPTRRAILGHLREKALSAGELASRFPVSRPAVSRHVRVLRDAGLLRQLRDKQRLHYVLDPAPLAIVDRWLRDYRYPLGLRPLAEQPKKEVEGT